MRPTAEKQQDPFRILWVVGFLEVGLLESCSLRLILCLHLQEGNEAIQGHLLLDQLKKSPTGGHHVLQDGQGNLLDGSIQGTDIDVTHNLQPKNKFQIIRQLRGINLFVHLIALILSFFTMTEL